jgi:hypothetical protein
LGMLENLGPTADTFRMALMRSATLTRQQTTHPLERH